MLAEILVSRNRDTLQEFKKLRPLSFGILRSLENWASYFIDKVEKFVHFLRPMFRILSIAPRGLRADYDF